MNNLPETLTSLRIVVEGVTLLGEEKTRDLVINNGLVESISAAGESQVASGQRDHEPGRQRIDARSLTAIPGMTDLYTRLREPGLTRKGSIATEANRALNAGFTRVVCSPDTQPSIDSVATVELIRHRAEDAQGAQVLPMAALTVGLKGEQLAELATLQGAGCPAAGQADMPLESTNVLYSAMEYAASFNMPLFMTPRDAQLGVDGCAHEGAVATRLGLPGIPVAAETVALARLLELSRETGCRLHISRISSARAVDMINSARQAALPVTCDVGLHHLFFTDEQLAGYDASFHSAVPFRSKADRDALRIGVKNGVIDAICSDHSPHDKDAKLAPFPATEAGLSAYEFAIPLILQLPKLLDMPLTQVFDKLIGAPARIVNSVQKTRITIGEPVNLFLLAKDEPVTQHLEEDVAVSPNHPLEHHAAKALNLDPLKGRIHYVFCNGRMHTTPSPL